MTNTKRFQLVRLKTETFTGGWFHRECKKGEKAQYYDIYDRKLEEYVNSTDFCTTDYRDVQRKVRELNKG